MCGLAGFFSIHPDVAESSLREHVAAMCAQIRHRGPDEAGLYVNAENGVALGHQRLSIIDLSTGQQPLATKDQAIWIVFNGEIYNFKLLREELRAKGFHFKTSSDTEVIVNAYLAWGEDCVRHLRGMFAFAIWDSRENSLFCARDRLGIKPLYYQWDGTNLIFGSELKAVLAHPAAGARLDSDALVDFLRLQYLPSPQTPFQSIRKLPAGHTLRIKGDKLNVQKYWDIDLEQSQSLDMIEAADRLREKLQEAVGIRLVSEVPIGAFLSGGTDSSIVVALMQDAMKEPVKTHCVGFNESAYDERSHARYIADRFSTDHEESMVNLNIADDLEKIIWHMDEPFADASAIPTYYLCQETRKRVTVSLSGDGGDELFCGYNWYAELARLNRFDDSIPQTLRRMITLFANRMDPTLRGATLLMNMGASSARRHRNLRNFFSDSQLSALLGMPQSALISHPLEQIYDGLATSGDPIKDAQYVDVKSYMVEDILMKVDKMSMAHSLEVRVPILDHQVVEYAFSLATNLKMDAVSRKKALKASAADLIPSEFFERKKQGFSVPLRSWLLRELKDHVDQYLLNPSRNSGMFNQREVVRLWNRFESGSLRVDLSHQLWSLLAFEMWHNQFAG